jgi:hypothetical protein
MAGTSSVPPIQFTLTGLVLPEESDILAGVQADQNAAFGGNLNPALNTPQGQLATSQSACIANANATFAEFVNQVDPDTADGFMQDAIARIYFLTRQPGTPTAVQCLITGLFGTVIPVGAQAIDTSGNIYICTQEGTIPSGGSITLSFANQVNGPVGCPANTLNAIYQAIPGWDSINNPADGVEGTNVETRAAFEFRRKNSVASGANGSMPSIYAAVFAVPGVIDAYVTQNNTLSVVAVGSTNFPVTPKSVYVAVVGGASEAVATAIWNNTNVGAEYQSTFTGTGSQAAGVVTISATSVGHLQVGQVLSGTGVSAGSVITSFGTYTVALGTGTVNVSTSATHSSGTVLVAGSTVGATIVHEQVTDPSPYQIPIPTYPVNYISPASTPIFFAVQIASSTSLPANIVSLVQQAILASFNGTDGSLRARIASLVLASKFYGPVSLIGPEVSILSILIGLSASPTQTSVQMGIDQAPVTDVAHISVTLI